MTSHPFDKLLLPGEQVLWAVQASAARRQWFYGLAMLAASAVLLLLTGPRFWALVAACYQVGGLFPLQFEGAGAVFGKMFPILMACIGTWFGVGLLKRPEPLIYGLSKNRTFVSKTNPKKRWTASSVIQVGGTVETIERDALFTLAIPIQHTGEDSGTVEFAGLSKSDFETALALVNKIVGGSAL
ncbi:MAG: hypothetical protein V4586_17390 [Pseudomonadota bacterium]